MELVAALAAYEAFRAQAAAATSGQTVSLQLPKAVVLEPFADGMQLFALTFVKR